MPDHIHMCVEIHPTISLREHKELFPMFDSWSNGYAAFTYSVKDRIKVINYIKRQKEHHKTASFRNEYESLMTEFGLDPKSDKFLDD